ncbi:MAG: DUF305 domain-containing protein [Ilumatobacter sp.]|uniref:DUF305 domain-containing protein n=1 Tax=Ilumatobacter sp. TaxID=1967498 RepID=UPI0032995DF8
MITQRLAALPLAALLAVTLAACGSDESPAADTPAPTGAADEAGSAVALNDADIEFAQGMIAHHEQAIEMAEIALDPSRSASPEVSDLATRIQSAQEPEIDQMTTLLTDGGASITMDMSEGHDMSSMDGMMTVEQMDALAVATGTEFDRMWLDMMIDHHEGAITQSETVQANGSNADALALAETIITTQQAEITEMETLLEG